MKRTFLKLGVLSSVAGCLLSAAIISPTRASQRARYGGLLRVEIRERVNSMHPVGWNRESADGDATGRLMSLVFDRLVELNDAGQPQPALAVSWQHDASFTHWQLQLRAGVKFHDKSPLTAETVVTSLQLEDS